MSSSSERWCSPTIAVQRLRCAPWASAWRATTGSTMPSASLLRSYQIDPSSATTAFNLAEVQYRRGDYDRARFYIDRVNKSTEQSNAQTLWLGARIEYKMGNRALAFGLGDQLRKRYPQSPETLAFEQGRFND